MVSSAPPRSAPTTYQSRTPDASRASTPIAGNRSTQAVRELFEGTDDDTVQDTVDTDPSLTDDDDNTESSDFRPAGE